MAFAPQDLLSDEDGRYNMAWSTFFLNRDHVERFLREATEDDVKHTLAAGVRYGWNTTRAAKELRAISGISLVSASWLEYQMSFLFSLALVRGIEVV
jgi:hypothetical protein